MGIAVGLISLLVGPRGAAGAGSMNASDIAGIEQVQRDFKAHWTAGDAAACAAAYTEDGVRVGSRGDVQHGRAEIQRAYAKLFSGPFQGASITNGPPSLRPLGHDYALCEAPFTITTARGTVIEGFSLDVMQKLRGRWWMLESHPRLYPSSPEP